MKRKTTYIYGLIDPENNKLRYIGKSDNPKVRLAKHIREAKRSTVLHRLAWIRGLLDRGLSPRLILLMEVPYNKWPIIEKLMISHLTDIGYDLTNMADGGLGGATAKGKKRSKATRKNISEGLKKLYIENDELREHQRQNSLAMWQDDKYRERRDAALNAPEVKAKMEKAQQKRWANPEPRRRQSRVGKRNWQDPVLRQIMIAKMKANWQNLEYRAKRSKSLRESWARRKREKIKASGQLSLFEQ